MSENESKYYDLSEDTSLEIQKIVDKISMPFNIKIKMYGNSKMKNLIKLQKMSDIVNHITNIDLIIYVNEDYYIKLEETNAEILIYQELDRLEFDLSKGTFKIGKFPLQTTPGVLKKYGIDAVAQANELVDLYTQQKSDGAEDQFNVNDTTKVTKMTRDVQFLDEE